MEHSKLPWELDDDVKDLVCDPSGNYILDCALGDYINERTIANAAFIVKACNNYEKLLAALEELARLGNGDRYGNSDGNRIAQKALKEAE